jgi:hypothetical protein
LQGQFVIWANEGRGESGQARNGAKTDNHRTRHQGSLDFAHGSLLQFDPPNISGGPNVGTAENLESETAYSSPHAKNFIGHPLKRFFIVAHFWLEYSA